MTSALMIKIIGGVYGGLIGAYVTGKVYDLFSNKPQNNPAIEYNPTVCIIPTLRDYKSFEEIMELEVKEYIDKQTKYNYEYDNEHGNTVLLKNNDTPIICDENPYINYFSLLFSHDLERKND